MHGINIACKITKPNAEIEDLLARWLRVVVVCANNNILVVILSTCEYRIMWNFIIVTMPMITLWC